MLGGDTVVVSIGNVELLISSVVVFGNSVVPLVGQIEHVVFG
jgi:hypothetical protein